VTGPDPALPTRLTAQYRVRFDETSPAGTVRGSALFGYAQDVAWRHSEALGFPRAWYLARGLAWLVRAIEAAILAPIETGETVTLETRVTGYRKVLVRRQVSVFGQAGDLRAQIAIDWAMTDGRRPVPIPAAFERVPLDDPEPFAPLRVVLEPAPADAVAMAFTPRSRELDPLNHVNSGVHLDWLDETVASGGELGLASVSALPRTYRLEYLRPVGAGAALVASAWRAGSGWAYRLASATGVDFVRGRLDPA
jgi:acyl-CoA thioesterase FadM